MSDELWRWDAGKLNEAIRTRAVSCKEAVTSCLTRVEAVNREINAIVEKCFDEAIATAENADRGLARGEPVKHLHGVPFTTKINTDQKGYATTNGVAGFANLIADDDSPSIANLRRAGAIVIGGTNCPEFSWRWFTDNDLFGETVNPWSRAHTCGGSTGGGAAAVATGMGPLAQGSDFGGSIRHPALCCGITGLRPSFGRVPAYNATTGDRPMTAQLMAVHGPLARSVNDLRVALAAMAQGDVRDPWWVPAPLVGPPPERPIRVAVMDSDSQLDAGIADALTQAAKLARGRWVRSGARSIALHQRGRASVVYLGAERIEIWNDLSNRTAWRRCNPQNRHADGRTGAPNRSSAISSGTGAPRWAPAHLASFS
jgi:amidase